ncbi:MAG: 3-deoxy-manno-octulosonate cytidylyltransferase [Rickettsiaceae bacterium]|nr:3-deoxy-manno-octulosonate cytidylyltransferase [Rickettsiaceae bacterium]
MNNPDYYNETLIVIPSRINSTRLPKKPLIQIGDKSIIEHVVSNLSSSDFKNILVATDNEEIAAQVKSLGVNHVMTDPHITTGTERVYKAWQMLENKDKFRYIVNVQGDMPFISATTVAKLVETLASTNADIVTPVQKVPKSKVMGESNVKVVVDKNDNALFFSRSFIPIYAEEFLYHYGIYAFRAESLGKFVGLKQSYLEKNEKLEQLRALEDGMLIKVCYVNDVTISVDTKEDLEKAINHYNTIT